MFSETWSNLRLLHRRLLGYYLLVVLSTVTKLVTVCNVRRDCRVTYTDVMLVARITRWIMADQSLAFTTRVRGRRTSIGWRRRRLIASARLEAGILIALALLKALSLGIAGQIAATGNAGVVSADTDILARRWWALATICWAG